MTNKEYTSQYEMFLDIRNERPHQCSICSKHIQNAASRCFAHVLPKGTYKRRKYEPNNLILVCGIECHHKVDSLMYGNKRQIEEALIRGERITVGFLENM